LFLEIAMATQSVEDYLKAIYKLQGDEETVSTSSVAARVRTTPAAVTKMLRHLQKLKLVTYTPYRGVRLTESGEKIALEVIRHHRLLERYLMEALGYEWHEVHDEAERLEHVISEDFEARIDKLLGHPTACPHGDPIPAPDGTVARRVETALADQRAPAELIVQRVRDNDPHLLQYLKERGLFPGTAITLLEQEPFEGALIVRIGDETVRVAHQAAQSIFVTSSSTRE
jgi:DtxR family transcriptional regulator, Mn-dependent transcriptional regulator